MRARFIIMKLNLTSLQSYRTPELVSRQNRQQNRCVKTQEQVGASRPNSGFQEPLNRPMLADDVLLLANEQKHSSF